MRISPIFAALALSAVCVGAANAQLATAPTLHNTGAGAGISFAYDAPRGQLTAGGIQLAPRVKSNVAAATTGTIDVTINIKLISKFGKFAEIPCAAIVIGGNLDLNNGTVNGGLETVTGTAKMSAANPGTAVCTVSIPYSWDLGSDSAAQTGLLIAYAAASVDDHGKTLRSTLQLSGIENLPANGTTSSFVFDAAL
jgi:hypothetical protein